MTPSFNFDNSYARLPGRFYARLAPTPVARPALVALNAPLAHDLGLDASALTSPEGVSILAGNRVPDGAEPLAQVYAGHQFGGWVPQLGDGRAILLGEVLGRDGTRRDIQLKGSGRTPFSRGGDGRAWLGPVLREYIVAEAMHALAIPTSRALAVVATGEQVNRESPRPGAVLTRVARSHVRVGTFQYFAARGDSEALALLTGHVIARHYPDASGPLGLLKAVIGAQARLIARWMGVGFIHGVMNTDNMSIAGETLDYGPCAFMDAYHPGKVFSSIDRQGRYAYANQPQIALWNLTQFASCLIPLIGADTERSVALLAESLNTFPECYTEAWLATFRAKLGLSAACDDDSDALLIQSLLDAMAANRADFTLTFRALASLARAPGAADDTARRLFARPTAFDGWVRDWRQRLLCEPRTDAARQAAMRAANPAFIARNHRVEQVIEAAMEGDIAPFHRLNAALARPFEEQPEAADLQAPPALDEEVLQTFCGT